MKSILKQVTQHPYWIVAFILVLSYLAFQSASVIKLDNNLKIWFPQQSVQFKHYTDFRSNFSDNGSIVVFYDSATLLTKQGIAFNQALIKRFESVENVKRVTGLSNLLLPIADYKLLNIRFSDYFESSPDKAKMHLVKNPLLMQRLVSKNLNSTLIQLDVIKNDALMNYRTMNRIFEVFNESEFQSTKFYVTGTIAIYEQINRLSSKESAKYFVISLIIIFVLFLFFYRSLKYALFSFSSIIISLIMVLGLFSFFGYTANNITSLLLVIILISTILNNTRLIINYKNKARCNTKKRDALNLSLNENFVPSLLSSILSAIAFSIYSMSALSPINSLSYFAVIAIFIPFILSYTLLPALIVLFDGVDKMLDVYQKVNSKLYKDSKYWSIRKKYGFVLTLIMLIFVVVTVEIESNTLSGIAADNIILTSIKEGNRQFSGLYPVELIIVDNNIPTTNNISIVEKIKGLEHSITELKSVSHIKSISTEIDFKYYFNQKLNHYRVSVYTKWLSNTELLQLLGDIKFVTEKIFNEHNYSFYITGELVLRQILHNSLFDNQHWSIVILVLSIFLLLVVIFKSAKIATVIVSIISFSMLIPVLGLVGIGQNIEVSLILFVSIGFLILLNPIFALVWYLFNNKNSIVIESDFIDIKKSNLISSVIIVIGIMPLVLSKYVLLNYFSLFIIASVITLSVILLAVRSVFSFNQK